MYTTLLSLDSKSDDTVQLLGIDETIEIDNDQVVIPGKPDRPELIPYDKMGPRTSLLTKAGRAGMLHAICHIEFNAINLALDAVWRYPGMPPQYYHDWLKVASEESYHFTLLADHLATLDCFYGDLPAHNSLWEMAEKTEADVLARMALVPRTLEARGLDASPAVLKKLMSAGDKAAAGIIAIILRDEVGHVAIGNQWYRYLCAQRNLDPLAHYPVLASLYKAPRLRAPFNMAARKEAGFDEFELTWLEEQSKLEPLTY
eukprot:gene18259-21851_t